MRPLGSDGVFGKHPPFFSALPLLFFSPCFPALCETECYGTFYVKCTSQRLRPALSASLNPMSIENRVKQVFSPPSCHRISFLFRRSGGPTHSPAAPLGEGWESVYSLPFNSPAARRTSCLLVPRSDAYRF